MPTTRTASTTLDRADHWALRGLIWVIVGMSVVFALALPLWTWAVGGDLESHLVTDVTSPDMQRATVDSPQQVAVMLQDPSAMTRLAHLLPGLIAVVATVWGAILLLRWLEDLRNGRPFAPATPGRLRMIGILLAFAPILSEAASGFAQLQATSHADPEAVGATMTLPIPWFVAGLVVLAISQAFARGAQLQADVDETI